MFFFPFFFIHLIGKYLFYKYLIIYVYRSSLKIEIRKKKKRVQLDNFAKRVFMGVYARDELPEDGDTRPVKCPTDFF